MIYSLFKEIALENKKCAFRRKVKVVWVPEVQTICGCSFDFEKWGGPQSPTPLSCAL